MHLFVVPVWLLGFTVWGLSENIDVEGLEFRLQVKIRAKNRMSTKANANSIKVAFGNLLTLVGDAIMFLCMVSLTAHGKSCPVSYSDWRLCQVRNSNLDLLANV